MPALGNRTGCIYAAWQYALPPPSQPCQNHGTRTCGGAAPPGTDTPRAAFANLPSGEAWMEVRWPWLGVLGLLSIALAACSSAPGRGLDGSAAGPNDSGTGEQQGDGSAAQAPVPRVECGTSYCTDEISPRVAMLTRGLPDVAALIAGFIPEPCCLDPSTATCGTSTWGAPCAAQMLEPGCPPVPSLYGIPISTCCTDLGMCGIIDHATGSRLCIEFGAATVMLGGFAQAPPPQACARPDAGTSNASQDAGT